MNLQDYLKQIHKAGINCYYTSIHSDIHHFVTDIISRGVPKELVIFYFPVVIIQQTNEVAEIVGIDDNGTIVFKTTFNKDGGFTGHSEVLQKLNRGE